MPLTSASGCGASTWVYSCAAEAEAPTSPLSPSCQSHGWHLCPTCGRYALLSSSLCGYCAKLSFPPQFDARFADGEGSVARPSATLQPSGLTPWR
eukprot:2110668-Prymnesium_polylepis.2